MKKKICFILIGFLFIACNGAFEKEPRVPTGLKVSGSHSDPLDGQISLKWDYDKDAGVYFIYRGKGEEPEQSDEFLYAQTSSTSYKDNDFELDDENVYYYKLSIGSKRGKYESELCDAEKGWTRKALWEITQAEEFKGIKAFEILTVQAGVYLIYLDKDFEFRFAYFFINQQEIEEDEEKETITFLDYKIFNESLGKFNKTSHLNAFAITSNNNIVYLIYSDEKEAGGLSTTKITVNHPVVENAEDFRDREDVDAHDTEIEITSFGDSSFASQNVVFGVKAQSTTSKLYCSLISDDGSAGYEFESYSLDTDSGLLWEALPTNGFTAIVDAESVSYLSVDLTSDLTTNILAGVKNTENKIELYKLSSSFNPKWTLFKEAIPSDKEINSGIVKKPLDNSIYAMYHAENQLNIENYTSSSGGKWLSLELNQKSSNIYDMLTGISLDIAYFDNGIYYKRYIERSEDDAEEKEEWNFVGRNSIDPTKKGLISDTNNPSQIKISSNQVYWLEDGKLYFARLN